MGDGPRDYLQFWHTIRTSVAKVARIHRAKFFHCLRFVSAGVNHAGIWSASARDCMREGGRSSSMEDSWWRGSCTCRNVNRLWTSTDCLQIIPSTRRSCGARRYVMRKQITAPAGWACMLSTTIHLHLHITQPCHSETSHATHSPYTLLTQTLPSSSS